MSSSKIPVAMSLPMYDSSLTGIDYRSFGRFFCFYIKFQKRNKILLKIKKLPLASES